MDSLGQIQYIVLVLELPEHIVACFACCSRSSIKKSSKGGINFEKPKSVELFSNGSHF